jgi:hypothetical protein
MNDREKLIELLNREGYRPILVMPDGTLCGIMKQLFTVGLFVGLNDTGYSRRYCYENYEDAVASLLAWDWKGDPLGPWIKEKPGDRLGPGATMEMKK